MRERASPTNSSIAYSSLARYGNRTTCNQRVGFKFTWRSDIRLEAARTFSACSVSAHNSRVSLCAAKITAVAPLGCSFSGEHALVPQQGHRIAG